MLNDDLQQVHSEAYVPPSTDAPEMPEPPAEEMDAAAVAEQADNEAAPLANLITARLVVKRSGAETDTEFTINPPATIGRFDAAVGPVDVDLGGLPEGVYVSRKHARLVNEEGVWKIQDLGSSNGTFVLRDDFEKVDEAELSDGQEFALGNARFVIHFA